MSSIGDRIAKGEEYKSKGNELFKAGKYKSAISKYGTVLAYIRGLPGSKRGLDGVASMINSSQEGVSDITTEQELSTTELEKVTLQNIATCHLKLLNYADALSFCNKAIKLDPKAWKAFLRKGEVYIQMGDLDNATAALNSAASACGSKIGTGSSGSNAIATDSAADPMVVIEKARLRVKALEKKFDQSQKQAYKNAFGRARKTDGKEQQPQQQGEKDKENMDMDTV